VGCKSATSSTNIRTPGIAMGIVVTAESADESTVRTSVQVGDLGVTATYVDLEGGDRLLASIDGGEEKAMQVESQGVYQTSFPTGAADTSFRVNLDRSEDDDAPNSVGPLPAPFDLTSLEGNTFSRANDAIEVTWDPGGSNDDMHVDWTGTSCIFSGGADIPGDTGTYTIEAATLDSTNDDAPETCDVTVTVTRTRHGDPDSILDPDSDFRLDQVRTTQFTSAP
jgi:hypothetical protein